MTHFFDFGYISIPTQRNLKLKKKSSVYTYAMNITFKELKKLIIAEKKVKFHQNVLLGMLFLVCFLISATYRESHIWDTRSYNLIDWIYK